MKRNIFKNFKISLVFVIILFLLASPDALASSLPKIERVQGRNRVETSIAVSKRAFSGKAEAAIIVGYDGEVDALTGTILAQKKGAPILISGKSSLGESLKAELKRLDPKEVFILGGTSVVSDDVEIELRSLGFNVSRIQGQSREETAINIASEAIGGNINEAFLSLGYETYADALAIGPVAARENMPLLLTNSNAIKDITLDFLEDLNIKKVNIIGGENAVSSNIKRILEKRGIVVTRVYGFSREETAVKIAQTYLKDPKKIFVASGYQYPDAVIGGYIAAREDASILLTSSNNLKAINIDYISKNKLDIDVLGGNLSISDKVYNNIKTALTSLVEYIPSKLSELEAIISKGFEMIDDNVSTKYSGKIAMEDLTKIIDDIINKGNYTSGIISSIRYEISNSGGGISNINLNIKYHITKDQQRFVDSEVERINREIIDEGMSDFEKVKTIHDYIANNTSYSFATATTPHSAFTLFNEGKGVCQAYALAAYKMLDQAGIDNYYVTGEAYNGYKTELHAWNLVKVDGRYYHMDVTWDDPLVRGGGDIVVYDYFLISEEKLNKDHKMDANSFPKAIDKRYELRNIALEVAKDIENLTKTKIVLKYTSENNINGQIKELEEILIPVR